MNTNAVCSPRWLFCVSVPVGPDHQCKWLDGTMGTGDEWDATKGKAFGLSDGKGHADAVFFEIVTLQLTAGDSVSETVQFDNFDNGFGCVYHSSATGDGKESRNFRGVGGILVSAYEPKDAGNAHDKDNLKLKVKFHGPPRAMRFVT